MCPFKDESNQIPDGTVGYRWPFFQSKGSKFKLNQIKDIDKYIIKNPLKNSPLFLQYFTLQIVNISQNQFNKWE